jgi:hypothetical protein
MIRRSATFIACTAVLALLATGCETTSPHTSLRKKEPTYAEAAAHPFIPANRVAAEALIAQLHDRISPVQPVIVATIVNIDALDRSSTLGRLVSEQIAARFSQAGYRIIEMKFRNDVYMLRDQGELMLSREIRDIATTHDAQAVIVGTYGVSGDFVFLNLKAIQPSSNIAQATHDYALPLDQDNRTLLRGTR